jgi:sugar phosphate isomerase/epimerase
MELSCASPMVPGDTLSAKAAALSAWGINAISVFWPYDRWDAQTHEELLMLKERRGVTPCEFALVGPLYGRLMDADPRVRAQSRAMYREAVEICAELGMVTELEYECCPQDPMPLFDPYEQPTPEKSRAFVELYDELCGSAADSGAQILLEPLNRYESRYLNSVRDCLGVLASVGQPQAGLLFDFFHASIEEVDIPAAIRLAGPQITLVHLADNNRLLPGRGSIDWPSCFAALNEVGFDGYLTLECSTSGDPARTLPAAAHFVAALLE